MEFTLQPPGNSLPRGHRPLTREERVTLISVAERQLDHASVVRLRMKLDDGSILVHDLRPTHITSEFDNMSTLNSIRALAALAMAATITETERNQGTFVLRTGDEPPDHALEERDARRRLREREQVRRDADSEKNAAIIRAERLKRKAENRVKRQPYGKGHVVINGIKCPAQQMPPDGNFRKRTTRYFYKGQWSAWCKDDHDIFVADA